MPRRGGCALGLRPYPGGGGGARREEAQKIIDYLTADAPVSILGRYVGEEEEDEAERQEKIEELKRRAALRKKCVHPPPAIAGISPRGERSRRAQGSFAAAPRQQTLLPLPCLLTRLHATRARC